MSDQYKEPEADKITPEKEEMTSDRNVVEVNADRKPIKADVYIDRRGQPIVVKAKGSN